MKTDGRFECGPTAPSSIKAGGVCLKVRQVPVLGQVEPTNGGLEGGHKAEIYGTVSAAGLAGFIHTPKEGWWRAYDCGTGLGESKEDPGLIRG